MDTPLSGKIVLLVTAFVVAAALKSVNAGQNSNKENPRMAKITKSDAEWKKELTAQQYQVMRKKGTEIPFTGELVHNKAKGVYRCAGCGAELFSSETKFDSGTGWPSFWAPVAPENIGYEEEGTHFMR